MSLWGGEAQRRPTETEEMVGHAALPHRQKDTNPETRELCELPQKLSVECLGRRLLFRPRVALPGSPCWGLWEVPIFVPSCSCVFLPRLLRVEEGLVLAELSLSCKDFPPAQEFDANVMAWSDS